MSPTHPFLCQTVFSCGWRGVECITESENRVTRAVQPLRKPVTISELPMLLTLCPGEQMKDSEFVLRAHDAR